MEYFDLPEFGSPSSDEEGYENVILSDSDVDEMLGKPEKFSPETLDTRRRSKREKIDYSRFNSSEFNEVDTLLTNVEDYSKRIREDVDRYARKVRDDIDLKRSEIELELANVLIKKIEAEKRGKEIIQAAEDSRDEIVKQGREEGFKAGFEEGEKAFKEENETNTARVLGLLEELRTLRLDVMRQYEEQFVQLSLLMAHRVVRKELKTDKTTVLEMLKGAMSDFEGMGTIKIKINPVEYDFILKHQAEISKFLEEDQRVTVRVDKHLSPASPVVESDFSVVDLDLKKQFKEIERELMNCVDDRRVLFKK
jgi:flagellar assembly protein FliH